MLGYTQGLEREGTIINNLKKRKKFGKAHTWDPHLEEEKKHQAAAVIWQSIHVNVGAT